MAKTIIEYDGKRYRVVRAKNINEPCRDCAFREMDRFDCVSICTEYDAGSSYEHIFKEVKQ